MTVRRLLLDKQFNRTLQKYPRKAKFVLSPNTKSSQSVLDFEYDIQYYHISVWRAWIVGNNYSAALLM